MWSPPISDLVLSYASEQERTRCRVPNIGKIYCIACSTLVHGQAREDARSELAQFACQHSELLGVKIGKNTWTRAIWMDVIIAST